MSLPRLGGWLRRVERRDGARRPRVAAEAAAAAGGGLPTACRCKLQGPNWAARAMQNDCVSDFVRWERGKERSHLREACGSRSCWLQSASRGDPWICERAKDSMNATEVAGYGKQALWRRQASGGSAGAPAMARPAFSSITRTPAHLSSQRKRLVHRLFSVSFQSACSPTHWWGLAAAGTYR